MPRSEQTRASFLLRLRDRDDSAGWSEFLRRYGDMLYRYVRGRGARHETAEDVVQEIASQFSRCVDAFEYDRERGRFRSYLRASALRALARHHQRERRQPGAVDVATLDAAADDLGTTDELWEREWRLQEVRDAVASVIPDFDDRTIRAFQMHVLEGCPAPRTAETLGLSTWQVYRCRDRVLRRLRDRLET